MLQNVAFGMINAGFVVFGMSNAPRRPSGKRMANAAGAGRTRYTIRRPAHHTAVTVSVPGLVSSRSAA